MFAHISSESEPLTRLTVAMAPALTRGLRGLPPCSSIAITELKGSPVGSAPIFVRSSFIPIRSMT